MEVKATVIETLSKEVTLYLSEDDYRVIQYKQENGEGVGSKVEYEKSLLKVYEDQGFSLKELTTLLPKFLNDIDKYLPKKYKEKSNTFKESLKNWIQDEIDVVEG